MEAKQQRYYIYLRIIHVFLLHVNDKIEKLDKCEGHQEVVQPRAMASPSDSTASSRAHSKNDPVMYSGERTGVHDDKSSYNSNGSAMHSHDFKVHTGRDIALGHSDLPEHAVHATRPHWDTESDHVYPFQRYDKLSHPEDYPDQSQSPLRRHTSLSPEDEELAWGTMREGLSMLLSQGYDVGVVKAMLPMVEAKRINKDMRDNFWSAYLHFKHRLDPKWACGEPEQVVQACVLFVNGFDMLFAPTPQN